MRGIRESRKQRIGSLPPSPKPGKPCKNMQGVSCSKLLYCIFPNYFEAKSPNSGQEEYFLDLIVDQYSTFALVWSWPKYLTVLHGMLLCLFNVAVKMWGMAMDHSPF